MCLCLWPASDVRCVFETVAVHEELRQALVREQSEWMTSEKRERKGRRKWKMKKKEKTVVCEMRTEKDHGKWREKKRCQEKQEQERAEERRE